MSKTEKPDDDPWKVEVEKVNRNPSKSSGKTTARSAKSGQYVTGSGGGTSSKEVKSTESRERTSKLGKGNDGNRHVVPNPNGGWDVVKENRQRASAHFDTKKEAESRAREIVDKTSRGNGEVISHGRDGKIQDSDSGRRNETKAKDTK